MTLQITVVITTDNLPKLLADLDRKTRDIMRAGLDKAFETADENVAVLTGALKDSGHIEDAYQSDRSMALIYDARNTSGDPYGRYVEFGTRFMGAQPFLTPAAFDGIAEMVNRGPAILET